MPDKQMLREKLLAEQHATNTAAAKNRAIIRQVLRAAEWSKVHSLHVYLPFGAEVDTRPFLHAVWRKYPAIKTASWQKVGNTYCAFWLQDGVFGTAVPDSFKFDAIIVPMLGFNDRQHRIGRGGGFYDRFLAVQPQAHTVGLCHESGRLAFQPEPHDIALTAIVTEYGYYSSSVLIK